MFRGRSKGVVTDVVSFLELIQNILEGSIIVLVIDWVLLGEVVIHLTEVPAIVLLGGTMNVVHDHQNELGLIKGEFVCSDTANLGAETLKCCFDGATEIEHSAECPGFETEDFPRCWTFGSSFDGLKNVCQPPFVNSFRTAIGMLGDLVNNIITNSFPEDGR